MNVALRPQDALSQLGALGEAERAALLAVSGTVTGFWSGMPGAVGARLDTSGRVYVGADVIQRRVEDYSGTARLTAPENGSMGTASAGLGLPRTAGTSVQRTTSIAVEALQAEAAEYELLDWDAYVEAPPPRRTWRFRARLHYIGRDKPVPADDPRANDDTQ